MSTPLDNTLLTQPTNEACCDLSIDVPGLVGAKGDKGDKGDDGTQGDQGPQGDPGPAGTGEILGTPTQRGIVKDIYISVRTDGVAGIGTLNDPFDGSTAAKFDTIFRGLAAYTVVHLESGVFFTTGSASYNGVNGYYLPQGVKIRGAGMRATTVRCNYYPVAAGANGHNVWEGDSAVDGDGSEVTDLTVDCNWQNLGAASGTKTAAIILYGNNCKIQRVRAINAYGNVAVLAETFVLTVSSYHISGVWQTCVGALIEDCLCDNFLGDYGGAINLIGSQDGSFTGTISGALRRNFVYNWHGTTAFGFIGNGIEISGNYTYNCERSVYTDTGEFKNISIHDNVFLKMLFRGIFLTPSLGNPHVKNVVIARNICSIADNNTVTSVAIGGSPSGSGTVENVIVEGNVILDFVTGTGIVHNAINFALCNGLIVRDNTVDTALPNQLYIGGEFPNTELTVVGNLTPEAIAPLGLADYSDTQISAPMAVNLFGTLRTSANRTVAGQVWGFAIPLLTNYTVVAGDTLSYEVYVDPSSPSFVAIAALRDAGGSDLGDNTLRDQNGHLGYADLFNYANGVFYSRSISLDPILGSTIHDFFIGGAATDEGGTPAIAGISIYYFRNIRILSSTGASRRRIYTDLGMSGLPVLIGGGTATNPIVLPYYTAAIFKYLSTSDPGVQGVVWNSSGVLHVSL